jgi:hypothetical protein
VDYWHAQRIDGKLFDILSRIVYTTCDEGNWQLGEQGLFLTLGLSSRVCLATSRHLRKGFVTTMSLTFDINRVGPLSQVAVGLGDLVTAYQLMTGAYGWYKARERTDSLTHVLSANGANLVSTSSFNLNEYRRIRNEHGGMRGTIIQDGVVISTPLPKASTAVPLNSGQACLRALTTGILCLYDTDTAIVLLQDLIPYALIKHDQEGAQMKMEGPILASLRDYVRSVSAEEDSDQIRRELLGSVTEQESQLTGIPMEDLLNLDLGQASELPYVVGVLNWGLTPTTRRTTAKYATRSLRAWSMANILHRLGFSIYPGRYIVTEDSLGSTEQSGKYDVEIPEVFMDMRPTSLKDQFITAVAMNEVTVETLPTTIPLGGVPYLAFRHLGATQLSYDVSKLVTIWLDCFGTTRQDHKRPVLNHTSEVRAVYVARHHHSTRSVSVFHLQLLNLFFDTERTGREPFGLLVVSSLEMYIRQHDSAAWTPDFIKEALLTGTCEIFPPAIKRDVIRNSYFLKAILLWGHVWHL